MPTQRSDNDWWRGAVTYQIYPRSFQDTTGNGVGDLPGIIDRLPHVASLGVDAIWISPFFKSPMADFGYDVADYRTVDPMFGDNEDAHRLVAEAHRLGLRVIFDMVLCHSSDQHDWFIESRQSRNNPRADWYVWADAKPDGSPPNNWVSVFGGDAWAWDAGRGQYYLHHFLASQPALNWNNPDVAEAMFDECRYWFDAGVDGLRLDAITTLACDPDLRDNPPADPASPIDFGGSSANPFVQQQHIHDRDLPHTLAVLRKLRTLTDAYPGRVLLGEIGDVDSVAVSAKYSRQNDALHTCYTFQMLGVAPTSALLRETISRFELAMGDACPTYALANHDVVRSVTRWARAPHLSGDDRALAKLVLAFLFSIRGAICLYQGEELGLPEVDIPHDQMVDPFGLAFYPEYKGRDGCRTPMPWRHDAVGLGFTTGTPWLPFGPDHAGLAVDLQEGDAGSALAVCRALLSMRRSRPSLVHGTMDWIDAPEPLLAFTRSTATQRTLCVLNISNRPVDWSPDGLPEWSAGCGDLKQIEIPALGGQGVMKAGSRPAIPAFGALFWNLTPIPGR